MDCTSNVSVLDNCTCVVNTTLNSSREGYENVEHVVPWLWGALIPLGVLGNGFVVYVMLRFGERKATNCYIVNLALADLTFVLIAVPLTLVHYIYPQWLFGVSVCKFHIYMIYVTLHATCMTLTAMTIDRYYAIVHPIKSMEHRTPKMAVLVSVIIWLVSFLLCIPFAVYHGVITKNIDCTETPMNFCRETWPSILIDKIATVSVVFTTYVIPLAIIITCYSLILRHLWKRAAIQAAQKTNTQNPRIDITTIQQLQTRKRRKATKLVAVVVILFATFWLPIHVFWLWFKFDNAFPTTVATYTYKMVGHTLSYTLSCINPFVYSFLGEGFRKALRKAFPRIFRNNQIHKSAAQQISPVPARDTDRGTGSTLHLQVTTSPQSTRRVAPLPIDHRVTRDDPSTVMPLPSSSNYLTPPSIASLRPKPVLAFEPRPDCSLMYRPRNNMPSTSSVGSGRVFSYNSNSNSSCNAIE